MLVREVMTGDPVTVGPDVTVKDAIVMLDRWSITAMPVVEADGTICGVVSEADLLRAAVPPDGRAQLSRVEQHHHLPHVVGEVMSRALLTVTGDTDLAEAAEVMTSTAVKSLPVVDNHRRVVGVVSRRDIVRLVARSDDRVQEEVTELFRSLGVDWTAEVSEGVVTVTGPVGFKATSLAETAAATVPGVVSVTVA